MQTTVAALQLACEKTSSEFRAKGNPLSAFLSGSGFRDMLGVAAHMKELVAALAAEDIPVTATEMLIITERLKTRRAANAMTRV
jgi:hypothetical protein